MTFLPSPRKSLIGEYDAGPASKLVITLTPGQRNVLPGTTNILNAKGGDILPEHVCQVNPRLIASHRASGMCSLMQNLQL